MKKLFFILLVMSTIGCQKEEKSITSISVSSTSTSDEVDFLNKDKEEACDTPELTENKIVEQAMKPAKANAGGALQGATDCEVE